MEKLQVRRVGVLVKPNQPEALQTICRLVEWCARHQITVAGGPRLPRGRIEAETGCAVESLAHEELVRGADLIVVLGGDGTMIGAARMVGDAETPVLGVNFGTLGYLADFTVEDMIPALEAVLAGDYTLDRLQPLGRRPRHLPLDARGRRHADLPAHAFRGEGHGHSQGARKWRAELARMIAARVAGGQA